MKIRFKILSGFAILAMMLLIAGTLSIYEQTTIGKSVHGFLENNYKSIDASKTMLEAMNKENTGILLLISGNWKDGRDDLNYGDSVYAEAYNVAKSNITIPGEEKYLERIDSAYRAFKLLWVKPVVGTVREGNLHWYTEDVHSSFLNVNESINSLLSLNETVMYKSASELKDRAQRAVMPGIVAVISAILFTIIFNFFINHYFVNPILRIISGIENYTKFKMPFNVNIETRDELLQLRNAIQNFLLKNDKKA